MAGTSDNSPAPALPVSPAAVPGAAGRKKVWLPVHGVLLLDKPSGMSSNLALQKARRLFSAAKAGHTGTLDPLASGLLPLCFGDATKFAADLLDADKTYEADLRLGQTTETGDAEGEILAEQPVSVTREQIDAVLPHFRGAIRQVPPMYSALKRDGKPLYVLARQGIEVSREAREIRIHMLEVLDFSGVTLRLRVTCSKGTYIRVLAEDIGAALGCGAHLTALRRTAVGELSLHGAKTLDELAAADDTVRATLLAPVDTLLQSLPRLDLSGPLCERFMHGNPVHLAEAGIVTAIDAGAEGAAPCFRVYGRSHAARHQHDDTPARLLGLGEVRSGQRLWPKRLVSQA